jgi:hypothetical protein
MFFIHISSLIKGKSEFLQTQTSYINFLKLWGSSVDNSVKSSGNPPNFGRLLIQGGT